MSRYNKTTESKQTFAYGFDNPLSQFFLTLNGKHLVGPLSKQYGDNYSMIDALKRNQLWDSIPAEHRQAIESDLAF